MVYKEILMKLDSIINKLEEGKDITGFEELYDLRDTLRGQLKVKTMLGLSHYYIEHGEEYRVLVEETKKLSGIRKGKNSYDG